MSVTVNLKVALARTAVRCFSGKHQLLNLSNLASNYLFSHLLTFPPVTSVVFNSLGCRTFLPMYVFSPGYIQYVFSEKKRREREEGEEEEESRGRRRRRGRRKRTKGAALGDDEAGAQLPHQLGPLPSASKAPARNPRV